MSEPPKSAEDFPVWLLLTECWHLLQQEAERHPPDSVERIVCTSAADRIEPIRAVYAEAMMQRHGESDPGQSG